MWARSIYHFEMFKLGKLKELKYYDTVINVFVNQSTPKTNIVLHVLIVVKASKSKYLKTFISFLTEL